MNTATDFDPFQDRPIDLLEPPEPYIGLTFKIERQEAVVTFVDKDKVYYLLLYVDKERNIISVVNAVQQYKQDFNKAALKAIMQGASFFTNLIDDQEYARRSVLHSIQSCQPASQRSNEYTV